MNTGAGGLDPHGRFFLPDFHTGDGVIITNGPFEAFDGAIIELDWVRQSAVVEVAIFGRCTPVGVRFHEITKRGT